MGVSLPVQPDRPVSFLEKYNNGYAYNMMFVGPGWLNKMGRWEQPYELLKKSYEDGMKYYGDLKKEAQAYRYDHG